jgi:hypothetical protein
MRPIQLPRMRAVSARCDRKSIPAHDGHDIIGTTIEAPTRGLYMAAYHVPRIGRNIGSPLGPTCLPHVARGITSGSTTIDACE